MLHFNFRLDFLTKFHHRINKNDKIYLILVKRNRHIHSQYSQYSPQLLPIDNNRVILSENVVKIEMDQHAHARSQRYKQDKTVHAGFASCSVGQTRTDNEIRGWKRGGRPYLSLPRSAQCEARRREERERGGEEEEASERAVLRLPGGTRRDVVQVDLWKVGGKRERGTLCVCVAGQPRFTVTGTNRWTNLT